MKPPARHSNATQSRKHKTVASPELVVESGWPRRRASGLGFKRRAHEPQYPGI